MQFDATSASVRKIFHHISDMPCWHVGSEFGTWLSMNFGQPYLEIREAIENSESDRLRRRRVKVKSNHFLWVEADYWEFYENSKIHTNSEQSRDDLRQVAARLEAQKLLGLEVSLNPITATFTFDHDCQLLVARAENAEPDDSLWHFYCHDYCLSLKADGFFEFGLSSSTTPNRFIAEPMLITL